MESYELILFVDSYEYSLIILIPRKLEAAKCQGVYYIKITVVPGFYLPLKTYSFLFWNVLCKYFSVSN